MKDNLTPDLPPNEQQDSEIFGFFGLFALVMVVVATLNAVFGFIGK